VQRLLQQYLPQAAVSRCSKSTWRAARLFDHFIGTHQKRGWNLKAERLCRIQVYDEIELDRLLDRDIGGVGPAQNLVDVIGSSPKQVREVWPKRNQPSCFDIVPRAVHRRQSRANRRDVDSNPVGVRKRIGTDIKGLAPPLNRLESGRDILRMANFERENFETKRTGCRLDRG
jgi:hypothetical protein